LIQRSLLIFSVLTGDFKNEVKPALIVELKAIFNGRNNSLQLPEIALNELESAKILAAGSVFGMNAVAWSVEMINEGSAWIGDVPFEAERLRSYIGSTLHGRIPEWLRINGGSKCSMGNINPNCVLGSRARCCPECLSEKPFWRLQWEHSLYTVCHHHGYLLVDQCPQCSKKLTWDRTQLVHCDCGSLITEWPREKMPEAERQLCVRLSRCIAADTGSSFNINEHVFKILPDGISTGEMTTLIRVFGTYGEMSNAARKCGGYHVTNIKDAHNLVRITAKLLEKWPSRLLDFFREAGRYELPDAVRQEPQPFFLAFTKALRTKFTSSCLVFVMTEYRRFITKNWRGVLNHRNTWAHSGDFANQRYMPVLNVATQLCITQQRVKELVRHNILRGHTKVTARGRTFIAVERDSIVNAEEYLNDQVTLSGAAILLGLPRGRVDELVSGGFLAYVNQNLERKSKRVLSRQEIATFIKRLSCFHREPVEDDLLAAHTILKVHLATEKEFVAFVSAITVGTLCPTMTSPIRPGFASLMFGRKEFCRWRSVFRKNITDVHISVVDAADRLGVKQEVAYHLARIGLLPSTMTILGKKKCRLIRAADLEQFQMTYVSMSSLATVKKTSPKALVKNLISAGIRPSTGPNIDGCRQYFFRRTDLQIEYINSSAPAETSMPAPHYI
jgi:hypothetical protein